MSRLRSAWPMTRRAAVGAMAAGGLGFAIFGPRGEREAAASKGRIVLDYWEKWTRHEGDAMVEVIDAFHRSQDRIYVRYIVTGDIGLKSMVAIAGGNPPDVIGLYALNVPPYSESNALIGLDELAPRFGVTLDRYAPGVKPVMMHQGKWWATVNTVGSVALYYNKALFREVGLDPEKPPRTIKELDEAHRKLVKTNAKGELERVGFLHREPGWWSWMWAYHFGGRIYDESSAKALVDSPENIRAMEWVQGYVRDLGVARVNTFAEGFGNYFTPENPFLTGKVAMIVQGPWVANLINKFKPDLDYGVAAFPVEDPIGDESRDPVGPIDTDVLVIPRGARHPEASMEFIAWTQRQDMTEKLATAHFKPSPLATASERFITEHPNRGIRVHYEILNSKRAYLPPRTRVWQQFKDEFDGTVKQFWTEAGDANAGSTKPELSVPAMMKTLQTRAQGLIDRAADERRRRGGGGGGAKA